MGEAAAGVFRAPVPPAPHNARPVCVRAAAQARNNARVMVSGSVDFFSNAFFDGEFLVPAFGDK